jgi:hypothetical protein
MNACGGSVADTCVEPTTTPASLMSDPKLPAPYDSRSHIEHLATLP